jgi:hypothetical protein
MNYGLQIAGVAEKLEGDDLALATKHLAKRNKPAPTELGQILKPDHAWYRLKPTKVELIYEPLFGFTRQSVPL